MQNFGKKNFVIVDENMAQLTLKILIIITILFKK